MSPVTFYNVFEAAVAGFGPRRPVVLRVVDGKPTAYTLADKRIDEGKSFLAVERFQDTESGLAAVQLEDWVAEELTDPEQVALVQTLKEMRRHLGVDSRGTYYFTDWEQDELNAYGALIFPSDAVRKASLIRSAYNGDYGSRGYAMMARRLATDEYEQHSQQQ